MLMPISPNVKEEMGNGVNPHIKLSSYTCINKSFCDSSSSRENRDEVCDIVYLSCLKVANSGNSTFYGVQRTHQSDELIGIDSLMFFRLSAILGVN